MSARRRDRRTDVSALDAQLVVALGAARTGRTRCTFMPRPFARSRDELADPAEADDAERLLVDLDAAELAALPARRRRARRAPAGCCATSDIISAIVCSAAAMMFDVGAFATMMPRLRGGRDVDVVDADAGTADRPSSGSALLDQVGGELGGGADQDRVVVADPLARARASSQSMPEVDVEAARAGGRRRSRRSSP